MAYFYRLIFSFLLLVFSSASFAKIPLIAGGYKSASQCVPGAYLQGSTFIESATAVATELNTCGGGYIYTLDASGTNASGYKINRGGGGIIYGSTYLASSTCPANSSPDGGDCSCNSPTVENASYTACIAFVLTCTSPQVLNAAGTACESPPKLCPANSIKSGDTCTCNSGLIMSGGGVPGDRSQCLTRQQACDGAASMASLYGGANASEVQVTSATYATAPQSDSFVCLPTAGFSGNEGCTAQWETLMRHSKPDGSWLSYGYATRTPGITLPCNGGGDEQKNIPTAPPITCKGQQGEINGVSTCIPFLPSTKTETVKAGKEESIDKNGQPLKVEKEVNTTCQNSICTTTTVTTTTSNVTVGGVSQTNVTTDTGKATQSKADYCTKNPRSPECGQDGGGGSSFGGSCEAGFKCDGDGLMCAMAHEQYVRNCQLFDISSSESAEYEAAKAMDKTKSVLTETEVNISSAMFSSTNILGGGACIADKPVVIVGHSITLPFSKVCLYLEYIGYLNLALAFLLAARIVSRG